jgi:hypothetical protein
MASIVFDGDENSLTLFDREGKTLGSWQATNRPESRAPLNYIPDGDYAFIHHDRFQPHTHGDEPDKKGIKKDSLNGAYGSYGIFRLLPVHRKGVQIGHENEPLGIHSGRFFAPDGKGHRGPFHMTAGCIRTSDKAMLEIKKAISTDPLTVLVVRNNGSVSGAARQDQAPKK